MMHNVGKTDRIVRGIIAIILAILYIKKTLEGTWGDIALALAILLGITSLRRCCPLYALLGFGTCGIETKESDTKIKTERLDLDGSGKS
ncbi:hypothetical protein BA6E_121609 [Bacteroidales bacterium 6E]|nr:hypothetical protein BA6E_121609 [Bacteroidales bacterium 6E]